MFPLRFVDHKFRFHLGFSNMAFSNWLWNSMSFHEICRGSISQNESCRPTRVHSTLLSVNIPHSSYERATVFHSKKHTDSKY